MYRSAADPTKHSGDGLANPPKDSTPFLKVWQVGRHHPSLLALHESFVEHNKQFFPTGTEFVFLEDIPEMQDSVKEMSEVLEQDGIHGVYDAFVQVRALAMRSDMWRAMKMWTEGGWYFDDKVAILEHTNTWANPLEHDLVLPQIHGKEIQNSLLFSARPRHPVWKSVIEKQVANVQNRFYGKTPYDFTTNPYQDNDMHQFDITFVWNTRELQYDLSGRTRIYHGCFKRDERTIAVWDSKYHRAVTGGQNYRRLWIGRQFYCDVPSRDARGVCGNENTNAVRQNAEGWHDQSLDLSDFSEPEHNRLRFELRNDNTNTQYPYSGVGAQEIGQTAGSCDGITYCTRGFTAVSLQACDPSTGNSQFTKSGTCTNAKWASTPQPSGSTAAPDYLIIGAQECNIDFLKDSLEESKDDPNIFGCAGEFSNSGGQAHFWDTVGIDASYSTYLGYASFDANYSTYLDSWDYQNSNTNPKCPFTTAGTTKYPMFIHTYDNTPSYSYVPWVARSVAAKVPWDRQKVVFLLRNPVGRAYQGFSSERCAGGYNVKLDSNGDIVGCDADEFERNVRFEIAIYEQCNFDDGTVQYEDCCNNAVTSVDSNTANWEGCGPNRFWNHNHVRRGLYYHQLLKWYQYVHRDDILIFVLEDVRGQMADVAMQIWDWVANKGARTPSAPYTSLFQPNSYVEPTSSEGPPQPNVCASMNAATCELLIKFYNSTHVDLENLLGYYISSWQGIDSNGDSWILGTSTTPAPSPPSSFVRCWEENPTNGLYSFWDSAQNKCICAENGSDVPSSGACPVRILI